MTLQNNSFGTKKIKTLFIAFIFIILSRPCFGKNSALTNIQEDIAEAVFLYQFEISKKALSVKNPKVYGINIRGVDPSPNFIARFSQKAIPVVKGSELVYSNESYKYVYKSTDQIINAIICYISKINMLDDNTAKVKGSYGDHYSGILNQYKVILRSGKWRVTKEIYSVELD